MMNRNFAASARKRLLRRGRALLRQRQDVRPPTSGGGDFLAGLSEGERHDLGEIHAALERIERGIYGRCESCFGDIDPIRLEAELAERVCQTCGERAAAADAQAAALAQSSICAS